MIYQFHLEIKKTLLGSENPVSDWKYEMPEKSTQLLTILQSFLGEYTPSYYMHH